MSVLDAAQCRLVWDPARGGAATRKGRTVRLAEPPDLGAGPVYACDYSPRIVASVTRSVSEPAGDMRPAEIAAADELLRAFVPSRPAPL